MDIDSVSQSINQLSLSNNAANTDLQHSNNQLVLHGSSGLQEQHGVLNLSNSYNPSVGGAQVPSSSPWFQNGSLSHQQVPHANYSVSQPQGYRFDSATGRQVMTSTQAYSPATLNYNIKAKAQRTQRQVIDINEARAKKREFEEVHRRKLDRDSFKYAAQQRSAKVLQRDKWQARVDRLDNELTELDGVCEAYCANIQYADRIEEYEHIVEHDVRLKRREGC
jgi:hypothetical protein